MTVEAPIEEGRAELVGHVLAAKHHALTALVVNYPDIRLIEVGFQPCFVAKIYAFRCANIAMARYIAPVSR